MGSLLRNFKLLEKDRKAHQSTYYRAGMIQNGEEETEENAMLTSDKADEHLPLCGSERQIVGKERTENLRYSIWNQNTIFRKEDLIVRLKS